MEPEDICVRLKELQAESRANPGFRSPGDEEFDKGDFVHITRKDGQEGRGWFLVRAFIQSINHNKGLDFCCLERPNNELLYLGTEGLPADIWARCQDRNQRLSEGPVAMSKLEGKGGKYGSKVAPVIKISRTEEAGSKLPACKARLRKCLGDSRLSGSGEAIEPEYPLVLFVV